MSTAEAPSANTFANVNYPSFLLAAGAIVGSIALAEQVKPEWAPRIGLLMFLSVGLLWQDENHNTALGRVAGALQSALGSTQSAAFGSPGAGPGSPTSGTGSVGVGPLNRLTGLNLSDIFGGRGFDITTPFGYGSHPGESYSFGGLTVHRGVDIVPKGLKNASQIIGSAVYSPIAGTIAALVPGDAEHRGVIISTPQPGLFAHVYHIDPSTLAVGQSVQPGSLLGTIANMSGPHVHYEIRNTTGIGGQSFDPLSWLR